jgi:hypothetical protein
MTQEQLKSLLHYDPDTGVFRWRETIGQRAKAGAIPGKIDKKGYRHIKIKGRVMLAHRLAWLYVHGQWPVGQLDHANRQPDDNRISNLREATAAQNMHNQGIRKRNKSGIKGVCWHKASNRWLASLGFNGKSVYLGIHKTKQAAAAAVRAARERLHGEFARHE